MSLVRRAARPMIAATFISGGIDGLRNPESKSEAAATVAPSIARKLPYLPEDPTQLVRINAATMVVAGSLFSLGRFPRLSAAALALTIIPTTAAGHRFWEQEDPAARKAHRTQFLKNLGLLGGLLLAVVDTEGRPGLAWRTRRAGKDARRAAVVATHQAQQQARISRLKARDLVH